MNTNRGPIKYMMAFWVFIWLVPGTGWSGVFKPADIYLVVYTTKHGLTGHVGMAVDNYRITATDTIINNKNVVVYDTVKDLTLAYFDLWGPPSISLTDHDKDLPARYYKLPRTSAEKRITVGSFLTSGLPHAYDYPCDALLRIRTDPASDYRMKEIASRVQSERNYFNSRRYNCTDYILMCLNRMFDINLVATEYIPFGWSSTPNRFYKEVIANLNVDIIKEAGAEVNESFFKERIMNTVLLNN